MSDATVQPAQHIRTIGCRAGAYLVQLTPRDRSIQVEVRSASVVGRPIFDAAFATEPVARLVARVLACSLKAGADLDAAKAAVYAALVDASALAHHAAALDAVLAADVARAVEIFEPATVTEQAQATADRINRDLDVAALAAKVRAAAIPALDFDPNSHARWRRRMFDNARKQVA